jgi:multidrug efflux system membrane fusion protein
MAVNRKLSSRVGAAAVVIGLACAGAFFLQHTHRPQASAMAAIEEGVPVIAAVAQAQDVPLFVRGIGTVQAYNMATIRTRVDGEIVKVAFQEGQDVKAGDPLFQIDPRPFQAALDEATATQARNQAQLVGAELDLNRYIQMANQGFQSIQLRDQQQAKVDALKG